MAASRAAMLAIRPALPGAQRLPARESGEPEDASSERLEAQPVLASAVSVPARDHRCVEFVLSQEIAERRRRKANWQIRQCKNGFQRLPNDRRTRATPGPQIAIMARRGKSILSRCRGNAAFVVINE